MLLPLTTTAFAATPQNAKSLAANRIESFVRSEIDATSAKILVSDTKTLYDFAGNEYKLVECSPTGYYIIHPESGIIIESSVDAKSPYAGLNSNLYYGGPTYYYTKSDNSYIHTIDKKTITNVDAASEKCTQTNKELIAQTNLNVANYIKGRS